MSEQFYDLHPFEMGVPKHWLTFFETLEMHHIFYTSKPYEMANLLQKQRLFNSAAWDIPPSQHDTQVDLRYS